MQTAEFRKNANFDATKRLEIPREQCKSAETRDRTGDLQIFGLTLSQLSYRGWWPLFQARGCNINALCTLKNTHGYCIAMRSCAGALLACRNGKVDLVKPIPPLSFEHLWSSGYDVSLTR